MTIPEAIGNLRITAHDRGMVIGIDGFDWLDTVELAISALERLDEKMMRGDFGSDCPACGSYVFGLNRWCSTCGQRIGR